MGQRTDGDRLFEKYLTQRGYDLPEHEPDLGIGVRIEYLLVRDGDSCLTEVKEFALESNPIKASGSYSQEQMLKPIRGQIHQAAKKLKKAKALGHPLVVVLTDPKHALSGLIGPREIIAAIRGDLSVVQRVSPTGPVGPATLTTGRNGELRQDHAYISAVTVIHERLTGDLFAHTFVTHSPDALPLAPQFFSGDEDSIFDYSEDEGTYLLREPVKAARGQESS